MSQFVLSSISIHNAIIGMWSIIILFSYENHCCLNRWSFPKSDLSCGWISNRGMKMAHGSNTTTNFDPTLDYGCIWWCRYWLIGVWLESIPCWVNCVGISRMRMHWWLVWASPMSLFIYGFTHGSNVIATRTSTTWFVGWMERPTYEIGVFINVFWVLNFKIVIHALVVYSIVVICVFMIWGSKEQWNLLIACVVVDH